MSKTLKIGMPALIEAPELSKNLALAKDLGLNFVEINSNLPIYQMDSFDIQAARRLMEESGLFLTLHVEEYLHLTDLNPKISALYQEILLGEIAAARQLGMPVLNLHLLNGVRYTLPEQVVYVFDAYREQFLHGLRELRERCCEAIGDSGIIISIENLDGYCEVVREGIDLLLQSPVFALTWDIGHDHCAGGVDHAQWMRHASRVRHLHIHDATANHNHLTLGTGDLDLNAYFAFAKEQGSSCVLEVKTAESLRQSVAYLRNNPEFKYIFSD